MILKKNKLTSLVVSISVLVMAAETNANSANISCGQPTKDVGAVRVVIVVGGVKVAWNVAGILKTDTPAEKATKIRAAAPPNHPDLTTDGTSMTVAGGTSNVVSATSVAGKKITGMAFKKDTTGEAEANNVFAVAITDNKGLASFAGTATGLDSDGAQSVITVTASGVTATVNPTAGMAADAIEDSIIMQLLSGGVQAQLANASFLASVYPGLEGDGRVIRIEEIDPSGLQTQSTDTGIETDISGMIDRTAPIPTVSEWGVVTMLLLVLVTGSIVYRRQSSRNSAF